MPREVPRPRAEARWGGACARAGAGEDAWPEPPSGRYRRRNSLRSRCGGPSPSPMSSKDRVA
eukprot:6427152-Pyramimonas_sp.AAC.1